MSKLKSVILDDYINSINGGLRFTKGKVKKDVLAEISEYLIDVANEMGGLTDDNFKKAIERFGDPKTVAKDIKETYGYGLLIMSLIFIPLIILSIFTVPISLIIGLDVIYYIASILVFLFIILSSIYAGKWFGLVLGIGANISRFSVLALILRLASENENLQLCLESLLLFILVGIMLLLVGYIPGHAIQKYNEGEFLQEYKMMKEL